LVYEFPEDGTDVPKHVAVLKTHSLVQSLGFINEHFKVRYTEYTISRSQYTAVSWPVTATLQTRSSQTPYRYCTET